MLRTLAIVQARLGSTRLPHKLARRLRGKSMLEWVVRRVTDAQHVDRVIVACGDAPENTPLRTLVPADVPVFVGSEHDVLRRFTQALEEYPAQAVVRVCADNPFVDPALIDRLVITAAANPDCDYISFRLASGRPVILSAVGLCAEWCRADALRRADAEARDPADREHVTRYLYSHPESFNIRLTPLPPPLDRDDLRLTVDIEEDWEHAEAICEALGMEDADWQRIAGLLHHQPDLRRRMADLNRRHVKA